MTPPAEAAPRESLDRDLSSAAAAQSSWWLQEEGGGTLFSGKFISKARSVSVLVLLYL